MRVMRVNGNYRILTDGSHLPEEVSQHDTDELLERLRKSLQATCDVLDDIHRRYDILDDIVAGLMETAGLDYDHGREWHLDCLIDGIGEMQETLSGCDDDIKSYEDSETVLDVGFGTEWYGSDNGIYVKVLEDSPKQEVVEEVILTLDEPVYRRRITVWEPVPGSNCSRHSKEIVYEDLPIDDRMVRLIRNTKAMRAQDRK
jgi:hypothetical protein